MSYCDTPEQAAIVVGRPSPGGQSVCRHRQNVNIGRFAQANPNCKMLYLAYNRAVRDEAEQKFPFNVECKTSHQLAWLTSGAIISSG